MRFGGLLSLVLLLLLLVACLCRGDSVSRGGAGGASKRDAKKRFIPFHSDTESVQEGSIIKMKAALIPLLCCCCCCCFGLPCGETARISDELVKVRDGANELGILHQDRSLVDQPAIDHGTNPDYRTVIGSIQRCAPTEVYAYGECRPNE